MARLWLLIVLILFKAGCSQTSEPVLNFEGLSNAHTQNLVTNEAPMLSPKGTEMVYPLITSDGTQQLYLANNDSRHPVQITFEGHRNHSPAWSPCGRHILFVSDRDGDDEIFIMDADGSHQYQLTFNKHWDGMPAWSPDGWPILFASDRDGSVEMVTTTTP